MEKEQEKEFSVAELDVEEECGANIALGVLREKIEKRIAELENMARGMRETLSILESL